MVQGQGGSLFNMPESLKIDLKLKLVNPHISHALCHKTCLNKAMTISVMARHSAPGPAGLHSLLDDVSYWRQIVPFFIFVEAWVQSSDIDGLLYPCFEPPVFCCIY